MIKDNLYNRSESHNIKSLSENELVKELAESIKKSDEGKTKYSSFIWFTCVSPMAAKCRSPLI